MALVTWTTLITLIALTLFPSSAWAGRGDDAFNRVIVVVDTSGSVRDGFFESSLTKVTDALPMIARYREDELLVIGLNGEPSIVWDGHATDLDRSPNGDPSQAWDTMIDGLRAQDRSRTNITTTMDLVEYALNRHPTADQQYVIVFSDMVHEAGRGGPAFDIEQDMPWDALAGASLHIVGVQDDLAATWDRALTDHGLIAAGSVVPPARLAHWRIRPLERAEEEIDITNPWAGRGDDVRSAAGTGMKFLLYGTGGIALVIAGLFGLGLASKHLRRRPRRQTRGRRRRTHGRRRRPAARGPRPAATRGRRGPRPPRPGPRTRPRRG